MGRSVPLVRAAALQPVFDWLEGAHLPVDRALEQARFEWYPWGDANRPVPLGLGLRFMVLVAEAEGIPDLGARAGSARGALARLDALGRAVAGGGSARDALARLAAFMPHWASGETLTIARRPGALSLVHRLDVDDPIELHQGQQFSAAILASVVAACSVRPVLVAMAIPPLPGLGVGHLRAHFADALAPSRDGSLRMTFATSVADPDDSRRASAADDEALARLAGLSLPEAMGQLIATMLDGAAGGESPTIRHVADAAGLSVRTLQRALAEAGTNFSDLLDAERRTAAMRALDAPRPIIGKIAQALGYGRQSSLTRAFRRWHDAPPSELRRRRLANRDAGEG